MNNCICNVTCYGYSSTTPCSCNQVCYGNSPETQKETRMNFFEKIISFLKKKLIKEPTNVEVDTFILRHKLSLFYFIVSLVFGTLNFVGALGFLIAGPGFVIFLVLAYLQYKKE